MCLCLNCEMLQIDVPIKVIDFKASSPFDEDISHFEYGYHCLYNGIESLNIKDLFNAPCRCRGA